MNMVPIKSILLQILKEARERNLSIGKTQLIKLLYLTEVEYYREKAKRLTDLDWVFYYYGPYAYELESILDAQEFERRSIQIASDREFIKFQVSENSKKYGEYTNTAVSVLVKKIIGTWGHYSLRELLDYIYFETEPMEGVSRSEPLQFEKIERPIQEQVVLIEASNDTNDKIKALRLRVNEKLKQIGAARNIHIHKDKDELNAIKEWDGSDPETTNLTNLKVSFTPYDDK